MVSSAANCRAEAWITPDFQFGLKCVRVDIMLCLAADATPFYAARVFHPVLGARFSTGSTSTADKNAGQHAAGKTAAAASAADASDPSGTVASLTAASAAADSVSQDLAADAAEQAAEEEQLDELTDKRGLRSELRGLQKQAAQKLKDILKEGDEEEEEEEKGEKSQEERVEEEEEEEEEEGEEEAEVEDDGAAVAAPETQEGLAAKEQVGVEPTVDQPSVRKPPKRGRPVLPAAAEGAALRFASRLPRSAIRATIAPKAVARAILPLPVGLEMHLVHVACNIEKLHEQGANALVARAAENALADLLRQMSPRPQSKAKADHETQIRTAPESDPSTPAAAIKSDAQTATSEDNVGEEKSAEEEAAEEAEKEDEDEEKKVAVSAHTVSTDFPVLNESEGAATNIVTAPVELAASAEIYAAEGEPEPTPSEPGIRGAGDRPRIFSHPLIQYIVERLFSAYSGLNQHGMIVSFWCKVRRFDGLIPHHWIHGRPPPVSVRSNCQALLQNHRIRGMLLRASIREPVLPDGHTVARAMQEVAYMLKRWDAEAPDNVKEELALHPTLKSPARLMQLIKKREGYKKKQKQKNKMKKDESSEGEGGREDELHSSKRSLLAGLRYSSSDAPSASTILLTEKHANQILLALQESERFFMAYLLWNEIFLGKQKMRAGGNDRAHQMQGPTQQQQQNPSHQTSSSLAPARLAWGSADPNFYARLGYQLNSQAGFALIRWLLNHQAKLIADATSGDEKPTVGVDEDRSPRRRGRTRSRMSAKQELLNAFHRPLLHAFQIYLQTNFIEHNPDVPILFRLFDQVLFYAKEANLPSELQYSYQKVLLQKNSWLACQMYKFILRHNEAIKAGTNSTLHNRGMSAAQPAASFNALVASLSPNHPWSASDDLRYIQLDLHRHYRPLLEILLTRHNMGEEGMFGVPALLPVILYDMRMTIQEETDETPKPEQQSLQPAAPDEESALASPAVSGWVSLVESHLQSMQNHHQLWCQEFPPPLTILDADELAPKLNPVRIEEQMRPKHISSQLQAAAQPVTHLPLRPMPVLRGLSHDLFLRLADAILSGLIYHSRLEGLIMLHQSVPLQSEFDETRAVLRAKAIRYCKEDRKNALSELETSAAMAILQIKWRAAIRNKENTPDSSSPTPASPPIEFVSLPLNSLLAYSVQSVAGTRYRDALLLSPVWRNPQTGIFLSPEYFADPSAAFTFVSDCIFAAIRLKPNPARPADMFEHFYSQLFQRRMIGDGTAQRLALARALEGHTQRPHVVSLLWGASESSILRVSTSPFQSLLQSQLMQTFMSLTGLPPMFARILAQERQEKEPSEQVDLPSLLATTALSPHSYNPASVELAFTALHALFLRLAATAGKISEYNDQLLLKQVLPSYIAWLTQHWAAARTYSPAAKKDAEKRQMDGETGAASSSSSTSSFSDLVLPPPLAPALLARRLREVAFVWSKLQEAYDPKRPVPIAWKGREENNGVRTESESREAEEGEADATPNSSTFLDAHFRNLEILVRGWTPHYPALCVLPPSYLSTPFPDPPTVLDPGLTTPVAVGLQANRMVVMGKWWQQQVENITKLDGRNGEKQSSRDDGTLGPEIAYSQKAEAQERFRSFGSIHFPHAPYDAATLSLFSVPRTVSGWFAYQLRRVAMKEARTQQDRLKAVLTIEAQKETEAKLQTVPPQEKPAVSTVAEEPKATLDVSALARAKRPSKRLKDPLADALAQATADLENPKVSRKKKAEQVGPELKAAIAVTVGTKTDEVAIATEKTTRGKKAKAAEEKAKKKAEAKAAAAAKEAPTVEAEVAPPSPLASLPVISAEGEVATRETLPQQTPMAPSMPLTAAQVPAPKPEPGTAQKIEAPAAATQTGATATATAPLVQAPMSEPSAGPAARKVSAASISSHVQRTLVSSYCQLIDALVASGQKVRAREELTKLRKLLEKHQEETADAAAEKKQREPSDPSEPWFHRLSLPDGAVFELSQISELLGPEPAAASSRKMRKPIKFAPPASTAPAVLPAAETTKEMATPATPASSAPQTAPQTPESKTETGAPVAAAPSTAADASERKAGKSTTQDKKKKPAATVVSPPNRASRKKPNKKTPRAPKVAAASAK
jgi:hypothetical protein